MVVNERGSCVSQKQEPKLCLVRPVVDLERSRLVLTVEGGPPPTCSGVK